MKAVVVFALLACAVVSNAQGLSELNRRYTYLFPTVPCSWYVTSECQAPNTYSKTTVSVFGKYLSMKKYNKNDELLLALVGRPDYAVDEYFVQGNNPMMMFVYDGQSCCNMFMDMNGGGSPMGIGSYGYAYGFMFSYTFLSSSMFSCSMLFHQGQLGRRAVREDDLNGMSFGLIEEAEYNGKKCRAYYLYKYDEDQDKVVPDRESGLYVDSDGFILGYVNSEESLVCNFTHGTYVTMSDFALSRRNVYGCSDERIYNSPKAYYGQCSASTVGAAITVVAASVIAAIVSLF